MCGCLNRKRIFTLASRNLCISTPPMVETICRVESAYNKLEGVSDMFGVAIYVRTNDTVILKHGG